MSSAAGGRLKKCALPLDFRAKKQHRTLAKFSFGPFGLPFPFPNAPFRSQLHQFRTLKVQWGHTSSAALLARGVWGSPYSHL
jgi:hypothetical protein